MAKPISNHLETMISLSDALDAFIKKVYDQVHKHAYSSLGLMLREGPPGNQKQPEETELQQWFCTLNIEDQEKILKIAKMAVKLTFFNFLVLLDNKTSGQPIQEEVSDFGLYIHTYESNAHRFSYKPNKSIRLNKSYSVNGDLHEAYDFEIDITDDA